jgi:hypothetical protein
VDKFLSIVCDNASQNDVLVKNIDRFIDYPGREANHVQCFCHIINLMCKSIIAQFDIPKKKAMTNKWTKPHGGKRSKKQWLDDASIQDEYDNSEANGMDVDEHGNTADEAITITMVNNIFDGGSELNDEAESLMKLAEDIEYEETDTEDEANEQQITQDKADGWVNERLTMTNSNRARLAKSMMPIWHILVKVGIYLVMCTSG